MNNLSYAVQMSKSVTPQVKSPSSLGFVAGTMSLFLLLVITWVVLPISWTLRSGGLFLSFFSLIYGAKRYWDRRLLAYLQGVEAEPRPLQDTSQKFLSGDLQSSLFDSLGLVFLSFDERLVIRLETPSFPDQIGDFDSSSGEDFANFFPRLFAIPDDEVQRLRFQFQHAFGMDKVQFQVILASMPALLELKSKPGLAVRIYCRPVFTEHRLCRVFIIMQCIENSIKTDLTFKPPKTEFDKFGTLSQVSEALFTVFIGETRKLLEEMKIDLNSITGRTGKELIEAANRMFRAVHTIKANAKLFRLSSIQEVSNALENELEEIRFGKRTLSSAVLSDLTEKFLKMNDEVRYHSNLYQEFIKKSDRIPAINIKYRVQWIRSLMSEFASILVDPKFEQRDLKLIQKEFTRALCSFDQASLADYIPGYNRMLEEVADSLGKEIYPLQVILDFDHFDATTLGKLNDILLHCLRNAIDHGIETPSERLAAGKNRRGQLSVTTRELDGMVHIEISDDGRGLDLARIKSRAIEMNIIRKDLADAMSDQELVPLLFHSGFSTASGLTDISGRGLGMDVIRDYIQVLNGNLSIGFEKGLGTRISFWIPASLEDYLSPLGVHDLHQIVDEVLLELSVSDRQRFLVRFPERCLARVFADKNGLVSALKLMFTELRWAAPSDSKFKIELTEHHGRRRVDSFVFYRMNIEVLSEMASNSLLLDKDAKAWSAAAEILKRHGGSLYFRQAQRVEANIPSHIPVRYGEFEFKILLFTEQFKFFNDAVDTFFKNIMGGWVHKNYFVEPEQSLPSELLGQPCIIVLESKQIPVYIEKRAESDRKKDGVVLIPEHGLDIDILNESLILPENILFAAQSPDEKHIHRCLAGVIFRRFLKEMVRDPLSSTQDESAQAS